MGETDIFYTGKNVCKSCRAKQDKEYYNKHREHYIKQFRENYKNNGDKIRAQNIAWAHSERGIISRRISVRKRIGTEKTKEYAKRWSKTPQGIASRKRRWARYIKTENGREVNLRKTNKRRYILLNTVCTLTLAEWKDILIKYNNRCAYCHIEFTDTIKPTRDHVIPLIRGGHHIKDNIVPACKSCNSRKRDKDYDC